MAERTFGKRPRRTWTDAEIEAIADADTEFPPISEEDLARALTASRRGRVSGPAPLRIGGTDADTSKSERP